MDAEWAGCPSTRKSTTGFVIHILGTPVSFGSRTQATIALSSAESELYAICTGTSEGLHLKMFLQESGLASKVNIRIHTDSTAGKSIATRQGTSKKAKHIDIRFLYTQQLTKYGIISIHKINTARNTADILTKYISRETLRCRSPCAHVAMTLHHCFQFMFGGGGFGVLGVTVQNNHDKKTETTTNVLEQ